MLKFELLQRMFAKIKNFLYFPVASYFRFFAAIRLKKWNPKIIVITGSNGKTTLLHMVEAQIGEKARYSHHANSSFGIPFDILDLHRTTLIKTEWIKLFLYAPLHVFHKIPNEKIYVVEADCDRPGEGKFLAEFLHPDVTLWVSSSKTHAMNFDSLVRAGKFETVEDAVAYEFGYFLEYCKVLSVIDGNSPLMKKQVVRSEAEIRAVKSTSLKNYAVDKFGTSFTIDDKKYLFGALLPIESFTSIAMTKMLTEYLDLKFDRSFSKFLMPPGRGSVFTGIKDITIVDSCYNANLSSMKAILEMYSKIKSDKKWAVIGDMLELGELEREEHEKLADILVDLKIERLVFLGPRVLRYTMPKLKTHQGKEIIIDGFVNPPEVLEYLQSNLKGEEVILFKGARFMEGIIENLLKNKDDSNKLSRREKIWEKRRKKWGL